MLNTIMTRLFTSIDLCFIISNTILCEFMTVSDFAKLEMLDSRFLQIISKRLNGYTFIEKMHVYNDSIYFTIENFNGLSLKYFYTEDVSMLYKTGKDVIFTDSSNDMVKWCYKKNITLTSLYSEIQENMPKIIHFSCNQETIHDVIGFYENLETLDMLHCKYDIDVLNNIIKKCSKLRFLSLTIINNVLLHGLQLETLYISSDSNRMYLIETLMTLDLSKMKNLIIDGKNHIDNTVLKALMCNNAIRQGYIQETHKYEGELLVDYINRIYITFNVDMVARFELKYVFFSDDIILQDEEITKKFISLCDENLVIHLLNHDEADGYDLFEFVIGKADGNEYFKKLLETQTVFAINL
jgi:hypothetical protein